MSTTGNTPGKWEYVEELGEVWAKQEHTDDFRVAIVEASNADGALMAASKEMLAALKMARPYIEEYACGKPHADLRQLDAAIAKAEGAP